MDNDNIWSVSDILRNRNSWSLSADSELLKHLQHLSESIVDKSVSLIRLLQSFENDVEQSCLTVTNLNNRFKSLSDTQFIENKVLDSPENEAVKSEKAEESENVNAETVAVKLKEALGNGLTVLSSHYDIITVSDSESENDEPQEILLKSCNPYMKRRLPYIIGTDPFTKYDHLGLVDSSSDEEEESESEEEEIVPEQLHDRQPVPIENVIMKPRTQIIQISSSDSEGSEISVPRSERRSPTQVAETNGRDSFEEIEPYKSTHHMPYSFADHLNAALQNAGTRRPEIVPELVDPFSPPPFPLKNNSDFSSDEEKSDCGDAIFDRNPDMNSNESILSKPSKDDDFTGNGIISQHIYPTTSSTAVASISEPILVSAITQDKKMSRALADEFKSKIFVNKKLPSKISSSDESDSAETLLPARVSGTGKLNDVICKKTSQVNKQTDNICPTNERNDNDVVYDHKPESESTVAVKSSKNLWLSGDEDDENDNDWFNQAASRNIPRNIESNPGAAASVLHEAQSSGGLENFFVNNTIAKNSSIFEPKSVLESVGSVNVKSTYVGDEENYTKVGLIEVKKQCSLFENNDGNDDNDEDDLFAKKIPTVSNESKTNELYDMLFDDSETDDPIEALVEENRRQVDIQRSVEPITKQSKPSLYVSKVTFNAAPETDEFDDDCPNVASENKKRTLAYKQEIIKSERVSENNLAGNSTPLVASDTNDVLFPTPPSKMNTDERLLPGIISVPQTITADPEMVVVDDFPATLPDASPGEMGRSSPETKTLELVCRVDSRKGGFSESVRTESISKIKADVNEGDTPGKLSVGKTKIYEHSSVSQSIPQLVNVENIRENTEYLESNADVRETNIKSKLSTPLNGGTDHAAEFSFPILDTGIDGVKSNVTDCHKLSSSPSTASKPNNSKTSKISSTLPESFLPSKVSFSPTCESASSISPTVMSCSVENLSSATENLIDENDGNTCGKVMLKEPTTHNGKITPGKLASGRGANINITALLPASKWSKPKEKSMEPERTLPISADSVSNSVSNLQAPNLLSTVKDRAKIPTKRRPSSRRARMARISEHNLFPEITVARNTDPISIDFDNNLLSESPSDDIISHQTTGMSLQVTEHSLTSISGIEKSTETKIKDVSSIFDDIFADEFSSTLEAKSTSNAGSGANFSEIDNKSGQPLAEPSIQIKLSSELVKENSLSDLEDDLLDLSLSVSDEIKSTSLIADAKNEDLLKICVGNEQLRKSFQQSKQTFPSWRENSFTNPVPAENRLETTIEEIASSVKPENSSATDLFFNSVEKIDVVTQVPVSVINSHSKKNLFSDSSDEDSLSVDPFVINEPAREFENLTKTGSVRIPAVVNDKPCRKVTIIQKHESAKSSNVGSKFDLFGGDDDDDDDDKLFTKVKKPILKILPPKKGSLFDDVEEDSDLFSMKTPTRGQKKLVATKKNSSSNMEKQRAVKLHGKPVVDDPLATK